MQHFRSRLRAREIAALVACLFVAGQWQAQATSPTAEKAAKPQGSAPVGGNPYKELKGLELRYFPTAHEHDPVEKRLERLECLVFGTAQAGTNDERFAHLKAAVSHNDQEAAKAIRDKSAVSAPVSEDGAETPPPKKPVVGNASSTQYPVLNTIEWRALQKTYGKESLDQRLNRLETQLFGQPAPAMSYVDRIERLKKMVGVVGPDDSPPPTALKKMPPGPLPRAFGRRPVTPFGSDSTPFVTPLPNSTFNDDYRSQLPSVMRQFQRHMEDMQRLMGEDMMRVPEMPGTPYAVPVPVPVPQKKKQQVPSYADPNSI